MWFKAPHKMPAALIMIKKMMLFLIEITKSKGNCSLLKSAKIKSKPLEIV